MIDNDTNWSKEYANYIKDLLKTKKYQGFTYQCLATQKKIREYFQEQKKSI